MAEKRPLAEINTNVMAAQGYTAPPSLGKVPGAPSSCLGKVTLPEESLLSGKDTVTGEGSKLCSGHAALNSFLPETVQLKREDRDDNQQEIDMELDEHGVCLEEGIDSENGSDDDQFSGDSWKEKSEKPTIVKNLLGQEKEGSYPRSSLKVLKALGLQIGCGDPLVAANLLPGP